MSITSPYSWMAIPCTTSSCDPKTWVCQTCEPLPSSLMTKMSAVPFIPLLESDLFPLKCMLDEWKVPAATTLSFGPTVTSETSSEPGPENDSTHCQLPSLLIFAKNPSEVGWETSPVLGV